MERAKILEKLAQSVAKKVSPSASDAKKETLFAQNFLARLAPRLKEARLILVGSTARDTGLHGDKDLDVFAAFPSRLDEDTIVKKTVAAVKKAVAAKWEMHYAEHPYLQANIQGYRVEVIPCFEAQPHQGIKSAVDRSPLHMDFLQRRLSASARQDVRALKVLLKNHGLYGAESHVAGFSGILCEYLLLHFGSFAGLVENARKWREPVRIEMAESEKKFSEPLTVIDAVDKNRNVAAVVSRTQFYRFVSLCQALWENPEKRLFFPPAERVTERQFEKRVKVRGTKMFVVSVRRPDVVEDILLPQAERTLTNLEKQLSLAGFSVASSTYAEEKTRLHFFIELFHDALPAVQRVQGPAVFNEKACNEFVKKKNVLRGPFVENERLIVEQSRDVRSAVELLNRVKKTPVRYGVASHLVKPFSKAHVRETFAGLSDDALQQVSKHLFRRESWL